MRMEERGGKRDGTARLGNQIGVGEQGAHGGEDLVLRDGDDAVDKAQDVLEVERAQRLRAEAVADGARGQGGRPLDQRARVEGLLGVGGQRRLGSPHAHCSVAQAGFCRKFDGCSDAAKQPTARDRREHQIHIGELLRNFQPAGGLAGDDVRMIVRRNDRVAVNGRELLRLELARRASRANEDDLGPKRARGVDFHLRSVVRHDNDGLGTECAGRVSDALGVVAA